MKTTKDASLPVELWLWFVATLIFAMVIVGGATRLTDSGLSITEWKPLLGAIPPLTEAHWLEAFEKYKLIPQYNVLNKGMTLEGFKFIYWWEWSHRLLGRFIGVAFALPLAFFVFTRKIERMMWRRLAILFVLGGLQGGLGWYMVASGLVDRVDVSQYRLAAHLSLAVLLFAAVVYTALSYDQKPERSTAPSKLALAFIGLVLLQVAAGGFVAGLDAGHAAYDWPTMNGAFIPDGLTTLQPLWHNWFENALAVQFNHRLLAYIILLVALGQWLWLRSTSAVLVLLGVCAQASLGVMTVMNEVPLHAALTHQAGALVLLSLALYHYVKTRRAVAA